MSDLETNGAKVAKFNISRRFEVVCIQKLHYCMRKVMHYFEVSDFLAVLRIIKGH